MKRRSVLAALGASPLLGGTTLLGQGTPAQGTVQDLRSAIEEIPLCDVHSHAFAAVPQVTEETFLEGFAMNTMLMPAYFPAASYPANVDPSVRVPSVYEQWKLATGAEKNRLDQQYGIQKRLDKALYHFSHTLFAHFLIKEMAAFFKCKPTVKDVVAARNERTKEDYWGYVNALFAAVKLRDMFSTNQIGFSLSARVIPPPTREEFSRVMKSRVHYIFNNNSLIGSLMSQDIPFAEMVSRFMTQSRREITDNKHLGFKSHIGHKGLDIQPWPVSEVEQAWEQWRKAPAMEKRRENQETLFPETARKVRQHLIWRTCELALELDVPFHIHSSQGESQARLSHQYPSYLENVVRYPVEFPQKPVEIVMIHGGYPHVDEAAYMAHLYMNVWYEISLMNPFITRGLHERMLTILETAPVSKTMYGSDGFSLPEIFYLAAKNGRRYIASALAVFVQDGLFTKDEAIQAARMILYENAHRLHKTGLEKSA